MLTENLTMSTQRVPIDNSCHLSAEEFLWVDCRTRGIMGDFYLCQNNRSECEHASPFGVSYLCWSPERCKLSKVSS